MHRSKAFVITSTSSFQNHPFPVKVKQVKMEVKSVENTVAIAILKTIGGEVSHSDASPTSVNPSGLVNFKGKEQTVTIWKVRAPPRIPVLTGTGRPIRLPTRFSQRSPGTRRSTGILQDGNIRSSTHVRSRIRCLVVPIALKD